jgi:predicted ATPase
MDSSVLDRYAATKLFVMRAKEVSPELSISATDASLIATLCVLLNGLPHAIELAAACVESKPIAEIAASLGDRLGLLTDGSPGAHPRQRTVRASIEWASRVSSRDSVTLVGESNRAGRSGCTDL